MSCIGRSDDADDYGQLTLVNATRALIAELPHIKLQLDAYNFDLRPERYFHFVDTTPPPLNTTPPLPPRKIKDGRTIQDHQFSTGGKLFGKITTDMLTRGNQTTNVTDPEAYYHEHDTYVDCVGINGTIWNGTQCVNRTETFQPYPEQGYATFLIFP